MNKDLFWGFSEISKDTLKHSERLQMKSVFEVLEKTGRKSNRWTYYRGQICGLRVERESRNIILFFLIFSDFLLCQNERHTFDEGMRGERCESVFFIDCQGICREMRRKKITKDWDVFLKNLLKTKPRKWYLPHSNNIRTKCMVFAEGISNLSVQRS